MLCNDSINNRKWELFVRRGRQIYRQCEKKLQLEEQNTCQKPEAAKKYLGKIRSDLRESQRLQEETLEKLEW